MAHAGETCAGNRSRATMRPNSTSPKQPATGRTCRQLTPVFPVVCPIPSAPSHNPLPLGEMNPPHAGMLCHLTSVSQPPLAARTLLRRILQVYQLSVRNVKHVVVFGVGSGTLPVSTRRGSFTG